MHILPPFIRKYGIIPESYKIAMTYEEQLLWLCKFIEDLKIEFDEFKTVVQNLENLVNSFDQRITGNTTDILNLQARIGNLETKLPISLVPSDITLNNGSTTTGLTKGYYYTGNCKVYIGSELPNITAIGDNSYFYFDPTGGVGFAPIFKIINDTTSVLDPITSVLYNSITGEWKLERGESGGTSDYEDLSNKPSINNVTLEGNKTLENLGINFFYKSVGISQDIGSFIQANDNGYYYTLENTVLRGTYNSHLAIIPNEGYLLTYNVGDTVTSIPFSFDGTASSEFSYTSGNILKAKGQFVAYVMDSNRVVTDKYVSSNYSTLEQFSFVTNENRILITWNDTTNYPAEAYYLEENNILIPEKTLFLMSKTAGAGFTPEFRIYPDPNTDYIYRIMYQAGTTYYDYLDVNLVNYFNDSLTHGDIVDGKTLYQAISGGQGGSYIAGNNIDITNNTISTIGDTIKPLSDSVINLYELTNGVYTVGNGQTLRCQSDNTKNINVSSTSKLIISVYPSSNERIFYLFGGYNNTSTLIGGTATASQGNYEVMTIKDYNSMINKAKGRWALNDNYYEITPSTQYTLNAIPLQEDYAIGNSYISYNSSTGRFTINKTGKYRITMSSQVRASSNNTSTCFTQKGFGMSKVENGTLSPLYVMSEQTYLTNYTTMYFEKEFTLTQGEEYTACGYCRILSGSSSEKTRIYNYGFTYIQIEFVE